MLGTRTHRASRILDRITVPNVAISFNERLKSSYTGALGRVVRATSLTEQDIPQLANGRLDEANLAAFGNTNNCTWKTAYDQSGNSRDYSQATSSRQPSAYVGGGSVRKSGDNVIAVLDGSNDFLSAASSLGITGASSITIFMLYKLASASSQFGLFDIGQDGHDIAMINSSSTLVKTWSDGDTGERSFPYSGMTTYHYDVVTVAGNMNTSTWRHNGSAITASATTADATSITNANPGSWVGCYRGLDGFSAMSVSAWMVWGSVLSSNEIAALEAWAEMRRLVG